MPYLVMSEQFFYPDGWGGAQIPRDISIALRRAGHSVDVVCGGDPYAPVGEARIPDPREKGVRIVRIPRIIGGNLHRYKLIRQLWFYMALIPLMLFRKSPDLYITQTNPPLIVTIVALVSFVKRRPFVIVAQDLYPEVLQSYLNAQDVGLTIKLVAGMLNWAYRRATRVVTLGPKMAELVRLKGVPPGRIAMISNWATGDLAVVRREDNNLIREWGLLERFVLLYSGNIGIGHEFETLLRAVKQVVAEHRELFVLFIGTGKRKNELENLIGRFGLENHATIKPFVPEHLLPQSYGLADLGLVTMREGYQGTIVPSKLLGHMARGIPTLYIGPEGDISCYIEASGGGVCFQPGDIEGVAAGVRRMMSNRDELKMMGEAVQRYYDDHLRQEHGIEAYEELIKEILSEREMPIITEVHGRRDAARTENRS
jgi:glycosyltransferase involved in cell wall biosynthesis